MSLDRICNDHDYRLDNVRWATRSVQNSNKRHAEKLTETGREFVRANAGRMTRSAIAAALGVSVSTVSRALAVPS